jgi:hypothetical protein
MPEQNVSCEHHWHRTDDGESIPVYADSVLQRCGDYKWQMDAEARRCRPIVHHTYQCCRCGRRETWQLRKHRLVESKPPKAEHHVSDDEYNAIMAKAYETARRELQCEKPKA